MKTFSLMKLLWCYFILKNYIITSLEWLSFFHIPDNRHCIMVYISYYYNLFLIWEITPIVFNLELVNIFLTFIFSFFFFYIWNSCRYGKLMFCELFIFTITISRYGYSTCMFTIFKFAKYYKILISCANNDQIPYFCQIYIPDDIFTSQVFFICLCSPSVCGENKQIQNTWLGKIQYP